MATNMEHLRSYFTFTRKERPGIIFLCVLLGLTAILPGLFPRSRKVPAESLWVRADSFAQAREASRGTFVHAESSEGQFDPGGVPARRSVSLTWFDPNTLTFAQWEALGLRERTINVILHYREKGGRFRKPEDLGKIWGLEPDLFNKLKPFVRIKIDHGFERSPMRYRSGSMPGTSGFNGDRGRAFATTPARSARISRDLPLSLDVNTADSLAWLALPGIGEKLTSRILNFRDKLGGFYAVEQVGETWGLPDSTFRLIRPRLQLSSGPPRQIPLNTASEEQLQHHPYIRFRLARTIIRYRQEHGAFATLDDLKRIALVTDDLYLKLLPYCTLY